MAKLVNAYGPRGSAMDQGELRGRLLDQRIALIEKHAAQRPATDQPHGPYGWTHGDLQYRNVIWRDGHIGAVIDWDRIRIRPYAEEITRTATIQFGTPDGLDLERVAAFVAGYRTIIPIDDAALADGVHRLWWKRMSDFWLLRTSKMIMRACE